MSSGRLEERSVVVGVIIVGVAIVGAVIMVVVHLELVKCDQTIT